MIRDKKDEIVMRTLWELSKAQERLKILKTEAARRGDRLKRVGHLLDAYPEYLTEKGESVDPSFFGQWQSHVWNDADILPAAEIRRLTVGIRAEIKTLAILSMRLRDLGH
jgi:hypothetical protein